MKMTPVFIRSLLALALVCLCGQAYTQAKPVDRQELRDSIQDIYKKLDNEYAVLEASRAYMKSADDLQNSFLSRLDITVGIISALLAFFALLFGGSVWLAMRAKMKTIQNDFNDKLQQHSNKLNEEYQKKLKEMYVENEGTIDRMMSTEIVTHELKKQTNILFIHKTNSKSQDRQLGDLQAVIEKRFIKTKFTHSTSLSSISDNQKFKSLAEIEEKFKLIVINDNFFDVNNKGFLKNDDDKEQIQNFFDILDRNNIGLVLFGNTKLHDLKLRYIAFSNNPYTVYTNINNLLKYINAVKS